MGRSLCGTWLSEDTSSFTQSKKPFKCNICGKSFAVKTGLTRHRVIHADQSDVCGDSFAKDVDLKRKHVGEKCHKCNICDATYARKGHLTRHQQMYTGEKLFKCSECDKQFAKNYYLTAHMCIHTGGKPHKCGRQFTRKSNLANHMKTNVCRQKSVYEYLTVVPHVPGMFDRHCSVVYDLKYFYIS